VNKGEGMRLFLRILRKNIRHKGIKLGGKEKNQRKRLVKRLPKRPPRKEQGRSAGNRHGAVPQLLKEKGPGNVERNGNKDSEKKERGRTKPGN